MRAVISLEPNGARRARLGGELALQVARRGGRGARGRHPRGVELRAAAQVACVARERVCGRAALALAAGDGGARGHDVRSRAGDGPHAPLQHRSQAPLEEGPRGAALPLVRAHLPRDSLCATGGTRARGAARLTHATSLHGCSCGMSSRSDLLSVRFCLHFTIVLHEAALIHNCLFLSQS